MPAEQLRIGGAVALALDFQVSWNRPA